MAIGRGKHKHTVGKGGGPVGRSGPQHGSQRSNSQPITNIRLSGGNGPSMSNRPVQPGRPPGGGNMSRTLHRAGTGLLEGLFLSAASRVVSNVVGTVSGEVSEVISQKSDLYQQEQAQKAQLARQEEAHRAQLARQEREREARLKYYTVCPFCDGVNQGAKFCPYCDSSLAYAPEEELR